MRSGRRRRLPPVSVGASGISPGDDLKAQDGARYSESSVHEIAATPAAAKLAMAATAGRLW